MAPELNIQGSSWPLVEVGRIIVLGSEHKDAGKIATIVEIIDQKRVLIDGPSADEAEVVSRQPIRLSECTLSKMKIAKLPRGARYGTVKKFWQKAEIDEKWKGSHRYQARVQTAKRRALTDFERFKVMRLKKQRQFEIRKALSKVKAAAT